MVPLFEANAYASFVNLFPEWLLLSYFIYLVLERYVSWNEFKMMIISGLLGALIFIIPSPWPQFIF
jgi:fluoride ion exporter CrcB/FEX